MSEITAFAELLLPIVGGLTLAVLITTVADRLPIPAPAVFLVAAALLSDIVPALADAVTVRDVERIAVVALIVILLDGGMDIGRARMRAALGPVLSLGVLGTFLTAGGIAVAAHVLLGFDWTLASLAGAALAPTDPAVVFSVLRGREIEGRSGTTLEGEAGVNDPAGIALMLGVVEIATHPEESKFLVLRDFAVEMGVGLAVGLLGGLLLLAVIRRMRLEREALFPVLILLLAATVYAVGSLAGGSGFLAVFVAGIVLGDEDSTRRRGPLDAFRTSLADLAELIVFVALGLTIGITDVAASTWLDGLILAVVLALVVRPLVVLLTLTGFGLAVNERVFIAWSGLKGAVPILLAAFALLGDVADAGRLYDLVFVVVLLSVVVQGGLVPAVARRLAVPMSAPEPAG